MNHPNFATSNEYLDNFANTVAKQFGKRFILSGKYSIKRTDDANPYQTLGAELHLVCLQP